MTKRRVTWNMGKMYGRGHQQGCAETESDYSEWYHLKGITYPELYKLIQEKGRITLRNNVYPLVMLTLSLGEKDDFYYILPIAQKLHWSFFQERSKGTKILLVWQGYRAQILLRKVLKYVTDEGVKSKILKALRWTPKGGKDIREESDLESAAIW